MDIHRKGWWFFLAGFLLCFIASGSFLIYYTLISPVAGTEGQITGWLRVVYVLHLALWMLLGMTANYLWDLFRNGKSWGDILLRDLFIPFFVSPIVFYGIYALWPRREPTFAHCLVAFQNG